MADLRLAPRTILIALPLGVVAFVKLPHASTLFLISIVMWKIWCAFRAWTLKRWEKQLYRDGVAAFKWHDDMTPTEFEERCAEAMRLAGWSAQKTKASGDQGVDVIAERNGISVVLQCKKIQ